MSAPEFSGIKTQVSSMKNLNEQTHTKKKSAKGCGCFSKAKIKKEVPKPIDTRIETIAHAKMVKADELWKL